MVSIAAFSSLVFALCGCDPRITDANVQVVNEQRRALGKIGRGISPKEVESILGQPTQVEAQKTPIEPVRNVRDETRYFYQQKEGWLVLHFVDNKLVSDVALQQEGPTPTGK